MHTRNITCLLLLPGLDPAPLAALLSLLSLSFTVTPTFRGLIPVRVRVRLRVRVRVNFAHCILVRIRVVVTLALGAAFTAHCRT
jgi:hypothetical protein